jgi:lactobin A/cerein 7B family class IIb bacteriocin
MTTAIQTKVFVPISEDEMTTVNGGVIPFIIGCAIAAVALSGCAQPSQPDSLDGNASSGSFDYDDSSSSGSGSSGKN